nr:hypothetical protein [Clostridiales bacterium]
MKKVSDAFCLILIICSALLCVFFPFMISQIVYDSLILCGKTVIPSLFFHMVLAKIFSKTDIINRAGHFLPDFIRRALNLSKNLYGCLFFGLVSGFPNGAVACGETYKKGLCSKSGAEYAVSLCNFPSLAFFCLIAGKTALGGLKGGIILYASSIIAVFVLSLILKPEKNTDFSSEIRQKSGAADVIVSSVKESAENMIFICAFIISFSVISGMLLYFIPLKSPSFVCAFKGIFEMMSGIISAKDISFPQNYVLASFLSGFSGISVIFQVCYVCSFYGLSAKKFVYSRIINIILMP